MSTSDTTTRRRPAAETTAQAQQAEADRRTVDLDITGMSCASCAARITKKLNKVAGVDASVNFATGKAHVLAPRAVKVDQLIGVVEDTGYGATPSHPAHSRSGEDGGGDGEHDAAASHHDHGAGDARTLRTRLIAAAVFSVPVIVLSMVPPLQFPGWQWLCLALTLPVVLWCGIGFHRAAWVNLRHGATTMDTLISMGSLASLGWSIWALVWGSAGRIGMQHHMHLTLSRGDASSAIYLEAACGVITFILAGRLIESRSRNEAGSALQALLEMGATSVRILDDQGRASEQPIENLAVGDRFVVGPGEKVAADGVVVEGTSAVDTSVVTGESVPVEVGPGDDVVGAGINASGRLVVEATAVGSDTQLSQIARLVEEAQTGRSASQDLADKVSGVFVPAVISISALTFVLWLVAGQGLMAAFTAAIAVLIIACPCALGLATPTALLAGTGRGARMGIVIRGPEALERARRIDTVVMDKTGTLTTGVMAVTDVVGPDGRVLEGQARRDLLALAGGLEESSEHPIGRAVVTLAEREGVDLLPVSDFQALPGAGVSARRDGAQVRAVRPSAAHPSPELSSAVEALAEEGRTVLVIDRDGTALGALGVADEVRASSARAVRRLHEAGIRTVMLTGDNPGAARRVAEQVGIDEVHAGVMPADKVDVVSQLREQGRHVAMMGDGVNDAAALAGADLGIAMGTGTDVAMAASDLTLTQGDPDSAVDALALSRATLKIIRENLFWAFAYNVIAIPVAALGYLTPVIAAAAMAFSSVFVVTNSVRLTRWTPSRS